MAEWQQCYANFVATADRRIRQALHQVYAQIVQSFRALSDRVNQYIPDIDTLRPHFEQLAITIKTKLNGETINAEFSQISDMLYKLCYVTCNTRAL